MHVLVIEHWFKERQERWHDDKPCLKTGVERKRERRRSEGSWHSIFSCWSSRINAPASRRVHRTFDFLFRPTRCADRTKPDVSRSNEFPRRIEPTNYPSSILPASIFQFIRLFSSLHLRQRFESFVICFFLFLFVPRLQFFAHIRK